MKCLLDNYFINHSKENGQVIKRIKETKITTCIYSFDFNEPIYIEWKNEQLKIYDDDIQNCLKNIIYDRYKTENKVIWIWYKKLRDEKLDIHTIRGSIPEDKNRPPYIDEFFRNELRPIYSSKYDDKNIFLEAINSYLEKAVERYF